MLLLLGIVLGSLTGIFFPQAVPWLKPVGDIFLNLLFVSVVPLVFFAVCNSVISLEKEDKFGKIILSMIVTFLLFILIAALFMTLMVYLFPTEGIKSGGGEILPQNEEVSWGDRIVSFFTVSEFIALFSRQNMLALLIFSFLLGTGIRRAGDSATVFKSFMQGGFEAMKEVLLIIMKIAPLGLGAYFAYQVSTIGPQLFGLYAKPLGLYYISGILYFFIFFSIYAFFAKGKSGITLFWKNNIFPPLTAISTCSSFATMPANFLAVERIGVPQSIANVVIPVGSTLHKNGSSMSSIVKIYVAFLVMGWNFFTIENILIALGITVFVSIVAGGIPNGGYIGEMLMISAYKLPQEAVPAVLIIGTLVDPLATVLNATGDIVAAMFVTKISGERFRTLDSET